MAGKKGLTKQTGTTKKVEMPKVPNTPRVK